jgi:hypothetical protein
MVSFLFWNLAKRPLLDQVVRIVENYDVDVVMLAECVIPPGDVLDVLNRRSDRTFTYPVGVAKNPGGSPRHPSHRVFRSGSSPEGAETNQPRATPWGRFPTACKP